MTGIILALATAILWALSPMFMAGVGRRIGSHPTNLLRLLIAGTFFLLLLPVYLHFHAHTVRPTREQTLWLILSGVLGMVAGDACFYEALVLLGPRRAIKVNTLAPVVALAIGWAWQNEPLTPRALVGTAMVISAVTYTAFTDPTRARARRVRPAAGDDDLPPNQPQYSTAERLILLDPATADQPQPDDPPPTTPSPHPPTSSRKEPGHMSTLGLSFGVASAVCIALGAVFARKAYLTAPADRPLDPILATVTRVTTAAALFWLLPLFTRTATRTLAHLRTPAVARRVFIGTACGAIAGMLCYVAALRHAPAGLVSTLVSTSTLFIIPLTALRYRTRIP